MIRAINHLHYYLDGTPAGGAYDSRELARAARLTIMARQQGIQVARVRQGFNGINAHVIDTDGNTWVPNFNGSLSNVSDLDEGEDWDGDDSDYEYEE